MPKYSIIIPVRKVNNYIKESIPHIKNLKYQDFEVIIVTDAPDEYELTDSRFRYVVSGSVGPAVKRNLGVKESKGEILAFLDDDAFPREDWLTNADVLFDDISIFALGGPAMTPKSAGFYERISGHVLKSFLVSGPTIFRHVPKKRMFVKDFPTVNLLVRKKCFNEIGGFITSFWPGEDTKLCLDLINKYKSDILYDPSVVVYHHRRDVIIPHLKQLSRYAMHRGQFTKIFPETSRLPSYYMPSLFILGLIAGPFVISYLTFLKPVYYFVVSFYLLLLFIESLKIGLEEKSFKAFIYSAISIFLTQVVYGLNFIAGLFIKPKLQLRNVDSSSGNYIGG